MSAFMFPLLAMVSIVYLLCASSLNGKSIANATKNVIPDDPHIDDSDVPPELSASDSMDASASHEFSTTGLDESYREKAFEFLKTSINFDAPICLSCLLLGHSTPGLRNDCQSYRSTITNSNMILPGRGDTATVSRIQLYLEQSDTRYPLVKQPFWLMVNLEWFKGRIEPQWPNVKMMFAKTPKQAEALMRYRTENNKQFGILLTGHTSADIYDPQYTRDYNQFAHIAGGSAAKNTPSVVEAWLKHPEWPTLTVVSRSVRYSRAYFEKCKGVANIDYRQGFLALEELTKIQNTNGVHVCPSSEEGFGHYINEGRAVKALILSSNGYPMNELVRERVNGVLIGRKGKKIKQSVAKVWSVEVTIADVEQGMERILALSLEERKTMGEHSRELYLKGHADFTSFMTVINSTICNTDDSFQLEKLKPYLY